MAGTGVAYPADAVTGAPVFSAIQGRTAFAAVMAGATSSRPLGGLTGVRPGTPSNSITASSTTWTLNSNGLAGYIDLESSAVNAGYLFSFSGSVSGTVTAAAGSARVDLVYIQINDSNTGDGSSGAPRVVMDYQAGTPGAGIPSLSAARAFVIAQINVPASGGGSPTVTWVAPYTVAAGGIQPVPAGTTPSSPFTGQYVDDATLGLLRFDGTSFGGGVRALATNLQTDTTNSVSKDLVQRGIGKITGAAATSVNEAVTFPVAFSTIPTITASAIGFRATGAFNAAGLTAAQSILGSPQIPSTSGFTAYVFQTTGSNLSAANDYYYSWIAIGPA